MPRRVRLPELEGAVQSFSVFTLLRNGDTWWSGLPEDLAKERHFLVQCITQGGLVAADLHAYQYKPDETIVSLSTTKLGETSDAAANPDFDVALAAVAAGTEATLWRVSTSLEYARDRPSLVTLPAPVQLGEVADEIVGFRFAKRSAGIAEYSIVVDLVGDGLDHRVSFFESGRLSSRALRKWLNRSLQISGNFLAEKAE